MRLSSTAAGRTPHLAGSCVDFESQMEPCAHAPVMAGTYFDYPRISGPGQGFQPDVGNTTAPGPATIHVRRKVRKARAASTGEQAEGTQSSIVKVLLVAAQLTIAQIGIAVASGPEGHVVIAMIAEPLERCKRCARGELAIENTRDSGQNPAPS